MDKAAKAELVMSKAGVSMDKAANARLSRRVTATYVVTAIMDLTKLTIRALRCRDAVFSIIYCLKNH